MVWLPQIIQVILLLKQHETTMVTTGDWGSTLSRTHQVVEKVQRLMD